MKITFNPLQIDADKWEKYYDTFPELFTVEEMIEEEVIQAPKKKKKIRYKGLDNGKA